MEIQKISTITLPANRVLWVIVVFTTILISLLTALNVIQYQENTILMIEVEHQKGLASVEVTKIKTFLETQSLIIKNYWLEKISEYEQTVGKSLLEANKTILKAQEGQ